MENNNSNVSIPHLSGVPQGDVVGNLCDEHSLLTKNSTQTEDLSNPDNDNSKLAEDINNFGITGLDVNANEFVEVMKEESVKSVESDNSDENLHKETDTELSELNANSTSDQPSSSAEVFVYDELQKSKASNQSAFLQPLLLQPPSCDADKRDSQKMQNDENIFLKTSTSKMSDLATPCMLCDYVEPDMYQKSGRDEYLCHLIVEHLLVIADVKLIADLQSYAVYWRKRFAERSLDEFCSKIRTNTGAKDIDKSEDYYLLCDVLPEDKKLREELQLTQLKKLLLRQEFERKDETFSRMCPFCTKFFQGNRIILFNHMNEDHNFNIGHPDNIVNVREFMDEIQVKLDALQCLYCEKVFKDRASLREHMRKKAHRRLNPKNKDYDKYYIINYLELGKNWETLQGESEKLDSTFDDWSGWIEEGQRAVCFFCDTSYDQADKIYDHMKEVHDFDFVNIRHEMQLSFYQQVKLINFIRREMHVSKDDPDEIASKIKENLKSSTRWNQPQYYFSTYEDDCLLCQLEDKDGLFEPEDTFVIGEDGIDCRAIVNNSILTDLVVGGYFDL